MRNSDSLVSTVFSFPALPPEDGLMGLSKPLPKQLWDAKKVRHTPLDLIDLTRHLMTQ